MKYFAAIMLTVVTLMGIAFASTAFAQEDEIIVTGTRVADSPGIFIEKRGNFLLLEVHIENDSREYETRLEEMNATIDRVIEAAKEDPDIILSLIDDNNFVRPLTKQAFIDSVRGGSRPDTSFAALKVKTNIPAEVTDSYKLAQKLEKFVDGIEETGRTKIVNYDDVSVSILNPYQYRNEVREKIITEMQTTKDAFGTEYVIIPKGLDGPVKWARSGDLNLAFYMNTSYKVYPKTLSIQIAERGEYDDED